MMLKKLLAAICLLTVTLTCLPKTMITRVSADISQKDRTLYDSEFFGEWNGEEWSLQPKLNYEKYSDLSAVEAAVKEGDYETAKYEYLSYYRNMPPRRERETDLPNIPSIKEVEMELFFEGILTYGNPPIGNATFSNEAAWVSYDVTDLVTNNLSGGNNSVSLSILARNKEAALISVNARESGENAAVLKVISNGVQYSFPVAADVTIRGGSYASENFGFEQMLYVRDSGWPEDDDAARAFFYFTMEGLDSQSRISSAQLMVYGSTDAESGSQETMLFKSEQATWEEGGKTWENSGLYTYSWQNHFYEKYNWKRPVGNYPDWSICVHRYYFLGGLSAYYRDTGDEKYAKEAIKFLQVYLSTNGAGQRLLPEDDRDAGLLIAVGMRMQAFPEILYRLLNSTNMTPDVFCEIMKYVYDELDFLYQTEVFEDTWTKDTNFGVEEICGQLTTMEAFPEFAEIDKWMERLSSRVDYQLATAATPLVMEDGSYIEATNSYSATVYGRFLSFRKMFENLGYSISDSYERQIRRMAYYFLNISEPNNYFSPYGDCPYMDQSELLERIADEVGRVYGDEALQYLGSGRERGTEPTHTSVAYPKGQLFIQRSGWEKEDLFLMTNTRINAVHGHNDDLHINLYAYGQQLLTDNPVYNYDENDINEWTRYRKQGHSTIEIDGVDGLYDLEANGSQVSNRLSDLFSGYTKGATPARGCYTQHDRQILFIKPAGFWIVSDLANVSGAKAGTHSITQSWQPQQNSNLKIDSETLRAQTRYKTGANIQIVPADPESMTASIGEGFYSGKPKDFLLYEKELEGTGNVSFDTILFPVREGDDTASATVERIETGEVTSQATALRIMTNSIAGQQTGYYYHSYAGAKTGEFAQFKTDGETVYLQTDDAGNPTLLTLYGGTHISVGPDALVSLPFSASDFSVSVENGVMNLSSSVDDESLFAGTKIKAEQVKEIRFNGRVVEAYFDGSVVTLGKMSKSAVMAQTSVTLSDAEMGVVVSGTNLSSVKTPFTKVIPYEASVKRLCDGDLSTVWTAEDNSYPQTVFFDFGEKKPLETMDIFWRVPSDGPSIGGFDFGISVSDDGKKYKEIQRLKSSDFRTSVGIQTEARFVKITVYGNDVLEPAGIRDVSFYEYQDHNRSLSDSASTAFSVGEEGETFSDVIKIVIPNGGDLRTALLGKGSVPKLESLTKLEAVKGNMTENSVVSARDKNDLVVYTKLGGTFLLSNGKFSLSELPLPEASSSVYGRDNTGLSPGKGNNYAGWKDNSSSGIPSDSNPSVTEPTENKKSFVDTKGHWAEKEIAEAAQRGLVNGVTEYLFEPNRSITRAEFAAVAVRTLSVPLVKYCGEFYDVSAEEWYADTIQTAFNLGLMKGYDDGTFCPNEFISRQEATMVMSQLLEHYSLGGHATEAFSDEESIAFWAKEAVSKTVGAGIFQGDEQNCFRPLALLTRAEAAAIYCRLLSSLQSNK